jgi:hypothetical protein
MDLSDSRRALRRTTGTDHLAGSSSWCELPPEPALTDSRWYMKDGHESANWPCGAYAGSELRPAGLKRDSE